MRWLRSLAFNVFFYLWLVVFLLTAWVQLPFSHFAMERYLRTWSRVAMWGMRWLGGVKARFEGVENIPDGPCVLASKHQSTWETFVLYTVVPHPNYILKQELMDIPLWGLYADKAEHIAVDRDAGARALKDMVTACRDRIAKGRQVVIFPEGTRTAPGESRRYHPGVAAIYKSLPDGVPVVPVALNSGVYWGRRRFGIVPGEITLKFLPPILPGLDRKSFMKTLETEIETASNQLLAPPEQR